MEEVWCNLGEAGGWRVTLGRSNAAELGSQQDTALKPFECGASHYFRLMLSDGHSLGAKTRVKGVKKIMGRVKKIMDFFHNL